MKNVANCITISRIVISILILITKPFSLLFYLLYIYCGVSDILDGFIARKLKTTSKTGEKVDSIADIIFILVCIIKILPNIEISIEILIWMIIIGIIKIFNIICGYIYNKKLTLPHTIANKITGLVLFIYPLVIKYAEIQVIEIIICAVATFSAIQEGHLIRTKKSF